MPEVRVSVVARSGGQTELGEAIAMLAPEPIVLSVTGHCDRRIRIDGRERRLSRGATGVLAIDYTRSTGYHRIEVDGQAFWFATEDPKLRLEGVARMLAHLRDLGTGWSGQALFSDGSGYLDPHVLYGWFDDNADEALAVIEKVLLSPRTEEVSYRTLSRRGGSSVLTVPTMRLLRSDPQRNVVEQDGGLLTVGQRAFNPTRVVARRRRRTVDTLPNRRAVHFLGLLEQLVSELLRADLPAKERARCRLWRERVGRLASDPLAIRLRTGPAALGFPRQGAELTDHSYGRVFDLALSAGGFGWSATANPAHRYSYIESADRIYQVYTAHRVAAALELQPTSDGFGSSAVAFSGPEFDLYYDCHPPADVAPSWRAATAVPDASKPDLLLHERSSGRVVVLDAKYRIGDDGAASEDSRKEVAAYQSLYGLDTVAIIYPGVDRTWRDIAGHGKSILEIPVYGPEDDLDTSIMEVIARLQSPPYL